MRRFYCWFSDGLGQVCELSTQVWEIEEPFIAPHLLEDAGIENLFERLAWTRGALRVGQQGSSECGRPQHLSSKVNRAPHTQSPYYHGYFLAAASANFRKRDLIQPSDTAPLCSVAYLAILNITLDSQTN